MPFDHFPADLLAFLSDLRAHNQRDWFQANKKRYEASVQAPLLEFVEAVGPLLAKISPNLVTDAKKSGGSIMRIYRDTRFSKDKTPYHDYLAAHFGHRAAGMSPAPCFYFKVSPETVWLGGGVYSADTATAARFRAEIDSRQADWRAALAGKRFRELYDGVSGEQLKRPPRGFDADHPLIEDLKRKRWGVIRTLPAQTCTTDGFLREVERSYRAAAPFMRFLYDAAGLPLTT